MTRKLEDHQISRDEWNALSDDERFDYFRLCEKSDYELYRLLDLVECPEHGACIPYLTEWIKARLV
jgi:succinate dehydrogenase flavin-adding protein (antitoxin of CptAB toxin-antitoxin module)